MYVWNELNVDGKNDVINVQEALKIFYVQCLILVILI